MSKKNKKNRGNKNQHSTKHSPNWKKIIKNGGIASAFIALIVVAITFYGKTLQAEYDVSVIGNGKATVVQIHDTNCQFCRRLKSNLDSVKGEFSDNIQFKTANILTTKGRQFASKHQVPHVTLLFFNKKGNRVNTLQGVTSKEDIKQALQTLAKAR